MFTKIKKFHNVGYWFYWIKIFYNNNIAFVCGSPIYIEPLQKTPITARKSNATNNCIWSLDLIYHSLSHIIHDYQGRVQTNSGGLMGKEIREENPVFCVIMLVHWARYILHSFVASVHVYHLEDVKDLAVWVIIHIKILFQCSC